MFSESQSRQYNSQLLWSFFRTVDFSSSHALRHTIHMYIQTLDNANYSQAQGLNWRCGQSLSGKRTVDINDEQAYGFLDEI